jgi:hypothetical protein
LTCLVKFMDIYKNIKSFCYKIRCSLSLHQPVGDVCGKTQGISAWGAGFTLGPGMDRVWALL